MLLIHLGFGIAFVRWVMSCITTVSFSVLINGVASPFFHAERGLRQGCPMSPLLFLLVDEGLSRLLKKAHQEGNLLGIAVAPHLQITHLLFVDDVLIFCSGTAHDVNTISRILGLFSLATGMEINEGKSTMTTHGLDVGEERQAATLFPYICVTPDAGFKYLGFCLKPNNYLKKDWMWLIEKMEKRLLSWSHRWLSRAGRLILVKLVLEAIPVYWMSLSWIPLAILDKAHRICLHFLWSGHKNASVTPWVRWEMIAKTKS